MMTRGTAHFPRTYRALVALGLSPAKALECVIDAQRPSTREHAMAWIRTARRHKSLISLHKFD
jgi:hypothetical protein